MTADVFDPAPAANVLAQAWRDGSLLAELPEAIRPRDLRQGYDIQDQLIADLGMPTVGWKLGVGSVLMKRQSGAGRSIAGRILSPRVHADGDTVALPNAAPVTIELEIAYVLGRDILPDEPDFPVADAIGEVHTAFELVLSRFVDRRAVGFPSFAADNSAFEALVLGPAIDPARVAELVATLVVTVDGNEAVRAASGEDVTDPLAAVTDLVLTARERGIPLPRGTIVSTGSASKPFPLAAVGAELTAHYLDDALSFRTQVLGPSAHGEAARRD